MSDSNCCLEPVSHAAVEEDGTSGFVKEVFVYLDKVGVDVVLLHGCPQSCMPNPVRGLLEVYEHMIKEEEDKADRGRGGKDNIREWTGLEFGRSQRAVENREILQEN